jgi:hypothetical protein
MISFVHRVGSRGHGFVEAELSQDSYPDHQLGSAHLLPARAPLAFFAKLRAASPAC